ncbi:MAG: NADH-quinone oxidoreductase subunit M [Ponticaulis sp.]|nr:NADH-quinone oxidoreductase subunit M [Ponticaulis sp.]|tara:strand:- start:71690 stop:73249 length:1560 start_codon:yes stop_codon:yes gene_type:complete
MGGFALLSFIIAMPAVCAILLLIVRKVAIQEGDSADHEARIAFLIGIVVSVATFLLSLIALAYFAHDSANQYQLVEDYYWFGGTADTDGNMLGGIRYKVGVDGLSLLLVLLTTFLTPLCFLASWGSIKHRVTEYVVAFLFLETLMLGVFCALDLMLFYVFFEGGLIPMFIIIGIWGGAERVYASFKFFLYTLLGSLFMLAAIIAMYLQAGTADIVELQAVIPQIFATDEGKFGVQHLLWLAFFASFAVKLPMWPVHTWLPDAHVQAPTAGSVILAGVLLKMGGYGFLRFSLPMFPEASLYFQPFVFALSVIAIVYASLVAFRQTDMKKLIAYSSVAHMGFVTLGIFSFTDTGIQGAIFQMISHGFISGALFLIVGVIYDRMHTRDIAFYGGLVNRMPIYAAVFMLFTMANVGLPGTSGFVGEILTMVGSFQAASWAAAGAALGVIFSAVYMLTLYRRTVFGVMTNEKLESITDLTKTEMIIFAPLVVATVVLGVYPQPIFDMAEASVQPILTLFSAYGG